MLLLLVLLKLVFSINKIWLLKAQIALAHYNFIQHFVIQLQVELLQVTPHEVYGHLKYTPHHQHGSRFLSALQNILNSHS